MAEVARAYEVDVSKLYAWRRKAFSTGTMAPLTVPLGGRTMMESEPAKFTRFEASGSETVEIVVGDIVMRGTRRYRSGSVGGHYRRGAQGMIASGVVVYVSCQPVDFRKGAASLMALVRDGGLDPFNGALYVFRSKRADRVRIVWWDGSGVCLYSKTLEENSFCWPGISAARVRLDHSQLMALLAGMDWKKIRPAKVRRPLLTG